jgi:hypothetical protein
MAISLKRLVEIPRRAGGFGLTKEHFAKPLLRRGTSSSEEVCAAMGRGLTTVAASPFQE